MVFSDNRSTRLLHKPFELLKCIKINLLGICDSDCYTLSGSSPKKLQPNVRPRTQEDLVYWEWEALGVRPSKKDMCNIRKA